VGNPLLAEAGKEKFDLFRLEQRPSGAEASIGLGIRHN
jgi:hypothetical protein